MEIYGRFFRKNYLISIVPLLFSVHLFCFAFPEFIENISQNRPANQSSTFSNKWASLAVDGSDWTCSVAGIGSSSNDTAWWKVDLMNIYEVAGVVILNTLDDYESGYLSNFSVYVSQTNDDIGYVCAIYNSSTHVPKGELVNLTCQSSSPVAVGTKGRYVTIKRGRGGFRTDALCLCEVKVYGWQSGISINEDPGNNNSDNDDKNNNSNNINNNSSINNDINSKVNIRDTRIKEKAVDIFVKPVSARQSSVYDGKVGQLAIDSDLLTCSLAGVGSQSPDVAWLQVDLGGVYSVKEIVMLNAKDYYESLFMSNFVISVDTTSKTDPTTNGDNIPSPPQQLCFTYHSMEPYAPADSNASIACSPSAVVGRYVTYFRLPGGFRQDAISVCEMWVLCDQLLGSEPATIKPAISTFISTTTTTSNYISISTTTPTTTTTSTTTSTTTTTTTSAAILSTRNSSPNLYRVYPVNYTQSSQFSFYYGYYALDDSTTTCAIMGEGSYSTNYGWFQVDIGEEVLVDSVVLVNIKTSDYVYLSNFAIYLGQTSDLTTTTNACGYYSEIAGKGAVVKVQCQSTSVSGRFLTVKKIGGFRQDALTICDLQIWAAGFEPAQLELKPLSTTVSKNVTSSSSSSSPSSSSSSSSSPSSSNGYSDDRKLVACSLIGKVPDEDAWYQADFGYFYLFKKVLITNSRQATEAIYLSNFIISIGSAEIRSSNYPHASQTCYSYDNSTAILPGADVVAVCTPLPVYGRYVVMRKTGGPYPDILALCAVTFVVVSTEGSCPTNMFKCATVSRCIATNKTCDGLSDCGDLSDEQNCTCPADKFRCFSDNRCLLMRYVCDGQSDCADGSDEFNCSCRANQFRCNSGRCIQSAWRCDSYPDCDDDSDEMDCACAVGAIRCNVTRICIPESKICDKIRNCPDNSDEANCSCQSYQYKCQSSGACIHNDLLCDGIQDCQHGDDEDGVRCPPCESDKFMCRKKQKCLDRKQRCDGVADCSDSSDEATCLQIDSSSSNGRPAALLVSLNGDGVNYLVCSDGWSLGWSNLACKSMLYKSAYNTSYVQVPGTNFLKLRSKATTAANILLSLEQTKACSSNKFVHLACQSHECGQKKLFPNSKDPYIVNGDLASPGAWPWQAQLFYNGAFRCGASIVADRWLLTAAHCLLDALENVLPEENLLVKVGTNLLADPKASSISVQRIINTPDFDNRAVTSDLALLKLKTPITFNDFVQPICLPDFDYQYEDMEAFDVCVVTGFGRTDYFSTVSKNLLQGRMNVMLYENCVRNLLNQTRSMESVIRSQLVEKVMICAGSTPSYYGTNACKGDSGGPYVCRDVNGVWTQVGIVSFGMSASNDRSCINSVFTKVSAFLQFIHDTINNYS